VKHSLTAFFPTVIDQPVVALQPGLTSYLPGSKLNISQQLDICLVNIFQARDMLFRHNQDMNGGQWGNIVYGQEPVILEYDGGWDLPVNYLAKKTITDFSFTPLYIRVR